jgi:parallel beta-helix repeat protein
VVQNNEIGIDVSPATVSGCLVQRNTVAGIFVDGSGSRIVGNDCVGNNSSSSSTDAAIEINDNGNQVEANRITGGYGGILVTSGNVKNVVIKNSAAVSAGLNFSVPSGNDLGPVGTAATSTSPWANISN